jgi:hypothetical protein
MADFISSTKPDYADSGSSSPEENDYLQQVPNFRGNKRGKWWSPAEDDMLLNLVTLEGIGKWAVIARQMAQHF